MQHRRPSTLLSGFVPKWAVIFVYVSGSLVSLAAYAKVEPVGKPRTLQWGKSQQALVISNEVGLTLEVDGPTALLMEFRSKRRGKRVFVDIIRDDGFLSRNAVKLRRIGGGRDGYRFATLLALKSPEGKRTYELRVQGAELVVIVTARKQFHRDFAVRNFKNPDAPRPEEMLVATPTVAPDPLGRDSEIFGTDGPDTPADDTPTDDTQPDAPAPPGRDAAIFGTAGADEGTMVADATTDADGTNAYVQAEEEAEWQIAITDDILSLGGQVYSQFSYTGLNNRFFDDSQLGNRNLLDAYFDARPLENVRAFIQGRLVFIPPLPVDTRALPSDSALTNALLDQLWLKFNVGRTVYITVGQQPIRWGTCRFWNPTDFINQDARDPLAVFDERVGIPLVKFHLPLETLGWNVYALASFERVNDITDMGGGLRLEIPVWTAELAISTTMRKGEPIRLGADISTDLLGFDFRAEAAVQHGVTTTFWDGDLNMDPANTRYPKGYQRTNDWIYQIAVGGEAQLQYGDNNRLAVGAEFFYNDAGYESAELYPWMLLNGSFIPLYMGRQYVALYTMLPNPGSLNGMSFTLTALGNLTDGSWLARLDYRATFFGALHLDIHIGSHLGRVGEFRFGFKVPPQPGNDRYANGLRVRIPVLDLGLGLLIPF